MKLPALAVLVLALAPAEGAQTLARVRLDARDAPALADALTTRGFDVLAGTVATSSLELVVGPAERAWLEARGFAPVVLEQGAPFALGQSSSADAVPGYPGLAAIEAALDAAAAAHPAICRKVDLTLEHGVAPTAEGRHVLAALVSDNVQQREDEPSFLHLAYVTLDASFAPRHVSDAAHLSIGP